MSRMLRIFLGILLLAGLAPAVPVAAQGSTPPVPLPSFCEYPIPLNGSVLLVCVPPNWNKDLVIFAHGYVDAYEAVDIPWTQLFLPDPDHTSLPGLITSLGYAFAATSYPVNGLVVGNDGGRKVNVSVQAVVDLATWFKGNYRQTNHIFLTGASEGGLTTALAVEQHPQIFNAGFATCGPIGDFVKETDYLGDFRMIFDYFYDQNIVPSSPLLISQDVIDAWPSLQYTIAGVISGYPNIATQLFNVTQAAYDPEDPTTIPETAVQVQWYSVFGTDDAIDKLGGNPYDNEDKVYQGSASDDALNAAVQRYAADPQAIRAIKATLQTSGRLRRPLVTMHNLLDPVVPYWHETLYTQKVLETGTWFQRVNITIGGYGHCNFTPAQVLVGFAVMVLKATWQSLKWSSVQAALPDPQAQQEYQTLMNQVAGGQTPTIYLPMIQH